MASVIYRKVFMSSFIMTSVIMANVFMANIIGQMKLSSLSF